MLLLPCIFALATVGSVAASPTPDNEQTMSFPLFATSNVMNGTNLNPVNFDAITSHVQHLQSKYAARSEKSQFLATRGASTAVPLKIDQNSLLWYTSMDVGTPKQKLNILPDVGSADIVVDGSAYNPSKSTTAKNTGKTFKAYFVDDRSAGGTVWTDDIDIGGLPASGIQIGRVDGGNLLGDVVQGLLGLAFPGVSHFPDKKQIWQTLYDQKRIGSPSFMFKYTPQGGQMVLGATAPGAVYVPVTSPNHWDVAGTMNGAKQTLAVDTGASLMTTTIPAATALFAQLKVKTLVSDGVHYGLFPCSGPAPQINFGFGGKSVRIQDAGISQGSIDGKGKDCVLSIIGADMKNFDGVILGSPFFLSTTVSFDGAKRQVGVF